MMRIVKDSSNDLQRRSILSVPMNCQEAHSDIGIVLHDRGNRVDAENPGPYNIRIPAMEQTCSDTHYDFDRHPYHRAHQDSMRPGDGCRELSPPHLPFSRGQLVRLKCAQMLFLIAVLFIFSWLPFNVLSFWSDIWPQEWHAIVLPFVLFIGHLFSSTSSIFYWYINKKAAAQFKKKVLFERQANAVRSAARKRQLQHRRFQRSNDAAIRLDETFGIQQCSINSPDQNLSKLMISATVAGYDQEVEQDAGTKLSEYPRAAINDGWL